jgi:predicted ATPase/DNA-binding SARP family transcriptional activator
VPPTDIRVEILGPLRLFVDGTDVGVPGPKRRAVLALLAMAEGRAVAVDQLLDAVWPSDPADSARATLHSHISRLRGHLGPAASRLEHHPDAYRLALDDRALDAAEARSLLADARRLAVHDARAAGAVLREARALWRGPALPDLQEVAPIAARSVALDELRRDIDDLLVECALNGGEAHEAAGIASEAVAAEPLREPAVRLLMRALAATGRGAAALRTAYEYRRRLVDETGLDPSPALGELERKIAVGTGTRDPVPRPPTKLVGRESETAALQRLLAHERLVTVVGPGGVGKTRVALEVAYRADAQTVLLLAPVTDPSVIAHALAATLDLRVVHGDVLSACAALLGAGPALLVVDNCEHLLDAARDVISRLLDACPELTVLTTSRESLGLPGESRFRVAPLPLPSGREVDDLARSPAVAVFVDRARRVRPEFEPGVEELRVVGDIVRELDGMPLAIELAAGRLSSIDLADLHTRVDRALDLLGDGRATSDARHRTLRATLEWSYELLPEDERRLFRHLSVFPDGFDLATAETVGAELGISIDPAGALGHLVDASMIDAELGGRARYRMLETLRSFGSDRLRAEGESDDAERRLLRWAVGLAEWIKETSTTDREPEADRAFRHELPNLRAAWHLARRSGDLDAAISLVELTYAAADRDLPEIFGWTPELLELPGVAEHPRYATVLGIAAITAWMRGDLVKSDRLARRGLELATSDEDRWACLSALASVDLSSGRLADAVTHALEAAPRSPRPSQDYGMAALAELYAGNLDEARAFADHSTAVATCPSDRAFAEYVMGELHSAAGVLDRAEAHYLRAIELADESGATFARGIAAVGLSTVRAAAGRLTDALIGYRELIGYWERSGNWIQQWTTLRNLAGLLRTLDDHEAALLLEIAADRAPESSAVSDTVWDEAASARARALDEDVVHRIRSEAESSTRTHVLEVARQAIERHLMSAEPARAGA